MPNTFLPAPSAVSGVAPSMIGPQGMKPMAAPPGGASALKGGIGDLAQALMLAKMRQGKPPITAAGNFTGNVGLTTGPGQQPAPPMPNMDPTAAIPGMLA